jgi:hypothetical protein
VPRNFHNLMTSVGRSLKAAAVLGALAAAAPVRSAQD